MVVNICGYCDGRGWRRIGPGWFFGEKVSCTACGGDGRAKPPGWPDPVLMAELRSAPPPAPPLPIETAEDYRKRTKREVVVPDQKPPELPPIPPIQILREDQLPPKPPRKNPTAAELRYLIQENASKTCPTWGIEYRYLDGGTYLINVPAPTPEEAIAHLEAAARNGKCVGQLKASIPASIPGAGLLVRIICTVRNFLRGLDA